MRLKIPFKFKDIKTTSERVRFDFAGHILNIEVEYLPFRLHHNESDHGDLEKENGIFYMNFYNEEGKLIDAGRAISHYVDLADTYKRKLGIEGGFKIVCVPSSQKAFEIGEVTYETIVSGASILVVV